MLEMAYNDLVFQQLCRLCLQKTDNCISIFSCDENGSVCELPEMLKNCLAIEVQPEDGYTSMICIRCKSLLVGFNSFKESCQDSQQRLRRLNRRKQVIELRRMAEDVVLEEDTTVVLEDTDEEEEAVTEDSDLEPPASSAENIRPESRHSSIDDPVDSPRPLAIWTVSQEGHLRANTTHKANEIIISEQLEEMVPDEMLIEDKEEASSKAELETPLQEENSTEAESQKEEIIGQGSLEDHNYSSTGDEEKEPVNLCQVIMEEGGKADEEENEEQMVEGEAKGVNIFMESIRAIESPPVSDPVKGSYKPPQQPLVLRMTLNQKSCPQKTSSLIARLKSLDSRFQGISGIVRIRSAEGEFKKKILINRNSKQIIRIPMVKAVPINSRHQTYPVLKVSKTLQSLEQAKALETGKTQKASDAKGSSQEERPPDVPCKTIVVSKGEETMKMVQGTSGGSSIALLRLKNKIPSVSSFKLSR